MATTVTVDERTRDEVRDFKERMGNASYDEAVDELLSIAAKEGYWSRDADEPEIASTEDLRAMEARVETLEERVEVLRDAMVELRQT